jgi:5-methylcytosine-specific restriction endonuclease McrA
MSQKKKAVREAFRTSVFKRDGHKCRTCGKVPPNGDEGLDAHHIFDRTLLPSGGYCKENGISVCAECHLKAEQFHITGTSLPGFSPEDLYALIGSSFEKALAASKKLE